MALFTYADEITMALAQSKALADEEALYQALAQSKALADEEALYQALEVLAIQDSKKDSEPSREDILAMIRASEEGAAEGNDPRTEPSEEKEECQDLLEDKSVALVVEDTMPLIFNDGGFIFFGCPHCRRLLSVAKGQTNCRQFVCVGKSDGTFANPHASRSECMRLLRNGWFGCGEAFTLPADGSPPIKREHG